MILFCSFIPKGIWNNPCLRKFDVDYGLPAIYLDFKIVLKIYSQDIAIPGKEFNPLKFVEQNML